MGVGRINLWVLDAFKSNGAVDTKYRFVGTVQQCDGTVLEWKGGRYQTKDGAWHKIVGSPTGLSPGTEGFYDAVPGTGDPGHITFELPPGRYIVSASLHIWVKLTPKGERLLLGNLATHKAVVQVRCNEEACVTLYQPSGWHCGIIMVLETLIPIMAGKGLINREDQMRVDKILRPVLNRLAPSEFDENETKLAKTIAMRLIKGEEKLK